jgi:hypothetical protein
MSNVKDINNRNKKKTCVCGGHNASNVKKNLNNNSTRNKYNILQNRLFIKELKGK